MARWAALVVAATTFLAVPSGAGATSDLIEFRHVMFGVSIGQFLSARAARQPLGFDWTSDGCSTPLPVGLGDTGRSFDFRAACQRHDFGYRNAPRLGVWNSAERARIDARFLADMRTDCSPRPWTQKVSCLGWAQTYYRAVRAFGGP
jgi:Prokaryotic phospholipase A2